MKRSMRLRRVSVVALVGGAAIIALADSEKKPALSLDQLPPAVQAAILQQAGAAAITEVEQETHGDQTVYEAEWKVGQAEHEAAFTAEGALLETEEEITQDQAPAAVRSAIARMFGADAKVEIAKKTLVVYEAEGKIDGKAKEVVILPTGRVRGEAAGAPRVAEHDDEDGDNDNDDDDD